MSRGVRLRRRRRITESQVYDLTSVSLWRFGATGYLDGLAESLIVFRDGLVGYEPATVTRAGFRLRVLGCWYNKSFAAPSEAAIAACEALSVRAIDASEALCWATDAEVFWSVSATEFEALGDLQEVRLSEGYRRNVGRYIEEIRADRCR